MTEFREEIVPGPQDGAKWRSDKARAYGCPTCGSAVFSTYEGDELPLVYCLGDGKHALQWGVTETMLPQPSREASEQLVAAAKRALTEMVNTAAPRDTFTAAVDALDAALADVASSRISAPTPAPRSLQQLASAAAAEDRAHEARERQLCARCLNPKAQHPCLELASGGFLRICPTSVFT